ncbi:MAG TPA: MFS transporter [Blastocatellia bacterium]|nr:MFS transporter [Blastocatellia bacterium]
MTHTPSERQAWWLLVFLTSLNVLNFVDRQLIVSLAPMLMKDLALSRAEIGLLYGYVFLAFYTVMGLILGNAADRWHRPRLIAMGLALWSALTWASGAARNLLHLSVARVFVGVGEATLTPAAVSMLSDVYPPKQRAYASGFYYAGVPLGAGASLLISGWIAPRYGWRMCFYVLGILGLLFVPLVLLVKNPTRGMAEAAESVQKEPTEISASQLSTFAIYSELFRALRRTPALPLAILAGVIINFALSAASMVLTWLVTERGFSYQNAAYINGGIFTVAGMLGTVFGGYVSDWFHRRWAGGRMWFLVVKGLVFLPFTLAFYSLPTETPFYLFYVVWFMSSMGSTTWYGPVFATVQDFTPARIRSTAVAFLLLALNLLGTGLGPLVAGLIGDSVSLWRGLLICACIGMTAIIPAFLAARRYQTDLTRAQQAEIAFSSAHATA